MTLLSEHNRKPMTHYTKPKREAEIMFNWLAHAIESVLHNVRNSTVLDLGVSCAHTPDYCK